MNPDARNSIAILAKTPLFSGLPPDQLREIKKIAVEKNAAKGQTIFSEGEEGRGFYIIAAGMVKIFKLSVDGKEQILHIFGPGEPFGEVPVFSGRPYPAHAETLTKSALLFFPRKAFIDLVAGNPSLSLNMLAVLSRRLRHFTEQIESLSLKEVPARLASYLLYLADRQEKPEHVTLAISKGHLASLLGTIPETLSRILSKMSAQRIIRVEGRRIMLLNREELEALSGIRPDEER
jgi:CRP/FNR family transcriptional regulator, dissimilatory nitrate respiration regulator